MRQSSRYLSLFFISFFLFVFSSQAQTYEWVKGGGTSEDLTSALYDEEVQYMCTDADGNIYTLSVVGNNPITADTFVTTGAYGADNNLFVASYNCSGQMRWAKLIGSANNIEGYGIATDNQGHIYIAGYFAHIGGTHTLYVGYDTAISANPYLATGLIQFDTSGDFNWISFVGANTLASISALGNLNDPLVMDGENNPHFICYMQSGVPLTPTITSQYGIYDLKYDATGTLISATRLQHDSTLTLSGATIDRQSDKLYIYGTRGDDFSTMSYHPYVAAFNTARNMIREDTLSNPMFPGAVGFASIAADEMGHLYLTTAATGEMIYRGDTSQNILSTVGYDISAILKLDTGGNLQWKKVYSATTNINALSGLTLMPNNKIAADGGMAGLIVCGTDSTTSYAGEGQNAFFTILDSSGHVQTLQQIHGSGFYDWAYAIASDNVGSLYIGGAVADNIWGGSLTPYTSVGGNTDFFVIKYGYDCSCTSAPTAAYTDTGTHTIGVTYTGSATGLDSVVWNFGDGYTTTVVPPLTEAVHTYSVAGTYNVCVTAYTECGTDEQCGNVVVHIHTAGLVGINSSNVNVYPNPANDELNVTGLTENTNYRLVNVTGQCISQGILQQGSSSISMKNAVPGVYVLELFGEDGEKNIVRVVKE